MPIIGQPSMYNSFLEVQMAVQVTEKPSAPIWNVGMEISDR
jgi:hypothetical protein